MKDVLLNAAKKHRKTAIVIGLVLGSWLILVLGLWAGSESIPCLRAWIELANGATWPPEWDSLRKEQPFLFAITLGTRTAINFAGTLAVIGSVVWFFLGGLERYMQMTMSELVRMHDLELVSRLGGLLKKRLGDRISDADLDAMHAEAKKFFSDWEPELKHHQSNDHA